MPLTTRAPAVMTTYKSGEITQAACRIDSVLIPRWDSGRGRHITNHAYVLIVKTQAGIMWRKAIHQTTDSCFDKYPMLSHWILAHIPVRVTSFAVCLQLSRAEVINIVYTRQLRKPVLDWMSAVGSKAVRRTHGSSPSSNGTALNSFKKILYSVHLSSAFCSSSSIPSACMTFLQNIAHVFLQYFSHLFLLIHLSFPQLTRSLRFQG